MADTLDREIARINRMHIPAGERHDMVKRAKRTWDCAFKPEDKSTASDAGPEWCALCGYHRDNHRSVTRG